MCSAVPAYGNFSVVSIPSPGLIHKLVGIIGIAGCVTFKEVEFSIVMHFKINE